MSIFAWVAAAAAAALCQAAAAQPTPTFKAGVELVRLDVRITDPAGRAIPDIRQDEVDVSDGSPLPIVFFQHVQEPAASIAEAASHTVAGEVSTNQGAARGQLYVLIFDQQHIAPGNEQRARQAAQRFVSTRLRPGDRAALYALPGPGPQIGFTADGKRLAAALHEVHGTAEAQFIGALTTMTQLEAFEIVRGNDLVLQRVTDRVAALTGSDSRARGNPATLETGTTPLVELVREDARKAVNLSEAQTRATLARLADVLRPLRAIEGRKTVLFISEGFPSERLSREIEEVAAAAAQSYSVVHALDINRREIDIAAAEPIGADQATEIHDKLSPLGTLAAETGGTLVIDAGSHADRAFATFAEESRDYYLVGFAPRTDPGDRAGYRRVKVRVRRDGARVSTRTGFTLASAAKMDRQQAIERAMAAPFPQQGLPVHYTTYVLRGSSPGAQSIVLSLNVELPIASTAEPQAADVAFIVRSVKDGRVAASGRDAVPLPKSADPNATVGTGRFRVQFEAPAGDYLMRAVVREPGGLVGTADRHFTVRALDGPSLATSDLVLGARAGDLPVRPEAFTDDGLSGLIELFARTAAQLSGARVVVDLIPLGDLAAVVSGTADLGALRETDRGVSREARIELPIANVTPGSYLARARVLSGGDTLVETARQVDVRHGTRPEGAAAAEDVRGSAFDPREVAGSAVAREFISRLERSGSPAAADGRTALDRLAARDYAAAIAAFEAVLNTDNRNGAAAFLLGWALHGAGEDRMAISAWRRSAYIQPDFVPAHLALADMFVRLSQPDLARQALRAGLTALPQSPELMDRLSRLEKR